MAPPTNSENNDERLQSLQEKIDVERLPRHVAIIMDGNGRWAKQRGLPRIMGHRAGQKSVHAVVKAASDLGVQFLTLYTFSAENWRRPSEEIEALMELIAAALREELRELEAENVQVRAMGRVEGLPKPVRDEFAAAYERTRNNDGLKLNIAVNYSGRWEIVDAVKRLAERVAKGELAPEAIDEASFASALYRPEVPDPELLIRTSGENRISNYLLWQIAYSEIYVTPTLWPDFRGIHLLEAIVDYQKRERRFGAIGGS